jgi:ATP synthase I subunit
MTSSDLTTSVTRHTAAAVVVLMVAGGWLGGAPGAAGVLAGGALALGSFRWLAARVQALSADGAMSSGWIAVTGLRLAAVAALAALAFAGGWVHPIALLTGYTVLPVALVTQSLRLAREESGSWT